MRTITDNKTRLWQLREDRAECRRHVRDLIKIVKTERENLDNLVQILRSYRRHLKMVDSEMNQVKDNLNDQESALGIGV